MIATFFYHNEKYTLPREDALAWDVEDCVFVAADGVTRDWGAVFEGARPYPDPSPATDAADAVAATALQTLRDCPGDEICARQALEAANESVADVNADLGLWEKCDYLECDLAGAVTAVSLVRGDTLTMGWIGDCGVAVVRNGQLVYLTRDQLEHVLAYLAANPAPYDDPRRVTIRRDLRNRPDRTHAGRPITYGVLTGEESALPYIETTSFTLRPGDVVATHTDGFRPYFDVPEFLAALSEGPARWEEDLSALMRRLVDENPEFGRERSLILYRHGG